MPKVYATCVCGIHGDTYVTYMQQISRVVLKTPGRRGSSMVAFHRRVSHGEARMLPW